jgi:hypothetical protein
VTFESAASSTVVCYLTVPMTFSTASLRLDGANKHIESSLRTFALLWRDLPCVRPAITHNRERLSFDLASRQEHSEMTDTLSPIIVNRQPREFSKSLKVIAFNAKGGRFVEGILTCLTRSPLVNADIILLCDVDWHRKRSRGREVARELAEALGMSFAYIPKRVYSMRTHSFAGNAILSSQPFLQVNAVRLSDSKLMKLGSESCFASRGSVASAIFNRHTITLGVVHLSAHWSPAGRKQQMAEFIAALPVDGSALIGGDFNSTTVDLSSPTSVLNAISEIARRPSRLRSPEQYEPLFEQLGEAGFDFRSANVPFKPTFTLNRTVLPFLRPKLDWLAIRRLSAIPGSASIVSATPHFFRRRVSDHDFVMCEIEL